MSDKTKEITELLSEACSSASDMTHGFKNIGDGDMKKGIQTVTEFFKETGEVAGLKKGAIGGSLVTLTAIGIIAGVKAIVDKNKAHKEKGEKIIQDLQKGIEEANSENSINNDEGSESAEMHKINCLRQISHS